MIETCLYKGGYKHLEYQQLKINDTKEYIVWIHENNTFYFRCYGLPDTINFCEKALVYLNREKKLNDCLQIEKLNNKEKLIIQNLTAFSEDLI